MTEPVAQLEPANRALTGAQQQLVLDAQGFARKATRFYARRFRGVLARDEVVQLIQLGLVEAARVFDPTAGIAFASFAWRRVGGRVSNAARSELTRDPIQRALGAALDLQRGEVELEEDAAAVAARGKALAKRLVTAAVLGVSTLPRALGADSSPVAPSAETDLLAHELERTIATALDALPDRPRRVVSLFYKEGHTLREASTALGVSYATARRDHDDAIDALRAECLRAGFEHPE